MTSSAGAAFLGAGRLLERLRVDHHHQAAMARASVPRITPKAMPACADADSAALLLPAAEVEDELRNTEGAALGEDGEYVSVGDEVGVGVGAGKNIPTRLA